MGKNRAALLGLGAFAAAGAAYYWQGARSPTRTGGKTDTYYEPHRALEGRPAEEIATEPAPTRHPREDHEQEIKEKSKFERH